MLIKHVIGNAASRGTIANSYCNNSIKTHAITTKKLYNTTGMKGGE